MTSWIDFPCPSFLSCFHPAFLLLCILGGLPEVPKSPFWHSAFLFHLSAASLILLIWEITHVPVSFSCSLILPFWFPQFQVYTGSYCLTLEADLNEAKVCKIWLPNYGDYNMAFECRMLNTQIWGHCLTLLCAYWYKEL